MFIERNATQRVSLAVHHWFKHQEINVVHMFERKSVFCKSQNVAFESDFTAVLG